MIVLLVVVVVPSAKEPHTSDHGFIGGQNPLSVIHYPVNMLVCKSVALLYTMRFEIWPFSLDICRDSFLLQIPLDCSRMDLNSIPLLTRPLTVTRYSLLIDIDMEVLKKQIKK